MKFSHLHVHTQFSLLDGAASIPALFKKAVKDGQPAIAITDHGNMFGAFKFVAEAGKHKNEDGSPKIKPIVGCEFYVVADRTRKQFTREEKDKRFHQLMLAKNAEGYKNLSKLCSLGYIDGFYSKYPRIDKELIRVYHEGLIATTCCLGASVPQAILRAGGTDLSKGRGRVQVVAGPFRRGLLRRTPTPRHTRAGPGEQGVGGVGAQVQRAHHREQRQPLHRP